MKSLYQKLARPTERFLGTDVDYLARGGFWTIGGRVIASGVAFLLSILYARYLTKELYGHYNYIKSIISIILVFTMPGLAATLVYAVARGAENTFKKIVTLRFFVSFLAFVLAWLTSLYLYLQGNETLALTLFIVGPILPFYETSSHFAVFFDAKKRIRTRVTYNAIIRIITAVCIAATIGIIYTRKLPSTISLPLLITVYFASYTLIQLFFLKKVWQSIPHDSLTHEETIAEGKRFALWPIFQSIVFQLDILLLYHLTSPVIVATYALATAPQEQLKGLLKSLTALAPAKMAVRPFHELQKNLSSKIIKVMLVVTVIVALYIAAAPTFYGIFFPKYLDAVPYSQIYMTALIFYPAALFSGALLGAGKIRSVYVEGLASTGVKLFLLILLTPVFGIMGAILAYVISSAFSFILLYILFRHPLPERG